MPRNKSPAPIRFPSLPWMFSTQQTVPPALEDEKDQPASPPAALDKPIGIALRYPPMARRKSPVPMPVPGKPLRIFTHIDGKSSVTGYDGATEFDLVSYRRGADVRPYMCKIDGVSWAVTIPPAKVEAIKQVMTDAGVNYMWVESLVSPFGKTRP